MRVGTSLSSINSGGGGGKSDWMEANNANYYENILMMNISMKMLMINMSMTYISMIIK